MKSVKYAAAFLAGASTFAFPFMAGAQENSDIVVTGSRIVTNGNNMPTPVTVITTDTLKDVRPGNIAEALNDLPIFNGSRGQTSNTGTAGAAGSPASSQNAVNGINLRQLGVQRTLVLFDGHRVAPSTPDGTVDLNSVPQMLLKRVDVVTGGVSAVYGSDAITGVLNFITDNAFTGLKTYLQGSRSTYGDADAAEGGVAFGIDLLDGKGHFMGSVEARHQAPIDSKFAREWGKNVYTLQGKGSAAEPYFQVSGARVSNVNAAGRLVNNAALGDSQFSTGGVIVPFVHGERLGLSPAFQASNNCATCEIGGDGGVFNGQLRAGSDMDQEYGRFDYDFSDNVHGYMTAVHSRSRSLATGNYTSNATYAISRDNAFLLPQYRTALGATTSFNLGKIFSEIPRGSTEAHSNTTYFIAGLDGSIGEWKWELGATHSDAVFNVRQNQAIDQGKFFASLDSIVSNGQAVCRAALTNPLYAGCVPLNPFGANAGSPDAIKYFMVKEDVDTKLGMNEFNGALSGSPFSLWAGPVQAALSAEYRELSYQIDSHTPDPTARANCVGIAVGCLATTPVFNGTVANVPQVKTNTSEAALEFQVPLLADMALAKSLDLNMAYRFAHYDRAGDANTWKVGATWNVNDMLTFRATRSRDFRAPTLDENFRATSLSAPARAFGDTLAGNPDSAVNQNPFASTLNGGNPDLKSEIGNTLSYGIVVHPFTGFDIAVDAFDIKMTDAIFLIQGNTPAYQNACYAGGGTSASNPGTSQYCQLIERNAAGSVTLWRQTFINLAELDTKGADIEVGYRGKFFDRPFSLRVLSTYQPHLIYKQPGIVDYDYAGSSFGTNSLQANPIWRATGFLSFKPFNELTVSVQERWRDKLPKVDGAPDNASAPAVYSGAPVKSVAYTNLNLTFTPKTTAVQKLDFYANVQNLFNTDPPQAGFWGNPTPGQFGEFASGDDVIGRYFTVGVRANF